MAAAGILLVALGLLGVLIDHMFDRSLLRAAGGVAGIVGVVLILFSIIS